MIPVTLKPILDPQGFFAFFIKSNIEKRVNALSKISFRKEKINAGI